MNWLNARLYSVIFLLMFLTSAQSSYSDSEQYFAHDKSSSFFAVCFPNLSTTPQQLKLVKGPLVADNDCVAATAMLSATGKV